MQRDVFKKAFTFHERFVLEVDPSQRFIKGLAELLIQPLNDKITNLKVNCRQCKIEKVFVNDSAVEFEYADAVSDLTLGASATIAHHQVYKSRYLNALRDADEGELIVKLPANSIQQISTGDSSQSINNTQTRDSMVIDPISSNPDKSTPALESTEPAQPTYTLLVIRIEYTLEDPRNGVVFVQKDDEIAPYRSNHVYTVNQPLPGATRAWLPCIDNIADRCTWDMEFIVPRKDEGAIVPEYDGEGSFDEVDGMVVVCSGEVLEQVIHPTDTTKKIVHYRLSEPTPAPFIGFAIGPFKMIKLSPSQLQEEVMTAADLDESQQQSLMAEINMMSNIYAFALPGAEDELSVSCSFLMHAMHFYTQEYGSYPFPDYKLVFVEDAWADTASSASLSICSSRLLHPDDIIDQIYSTRRELSQALARQWFGIYIVQKSWPDTWLVRGIANLMGSLFIKRHLGNNEYRLRLKKDMELCCKLDINRPPVYNQALPYPLDPEDLDFIDLKAPLVIYMLDKRMCKGGGTLGLSRVLPKLLVSAMSGELAQNAISTHYFLRLCRKVSGFDTKVFAEQWIYKSGCPKFNFKFHFNRKKMVVEIHMSQENTNSSLATGQEHLGASMDGSTVNYQELMSPLFTGNLTVRIHEADGTPYEHILDIQSPQHKFEVQFNTKYKRIRRNTKRFLAKQAAAAAAVAEEEQENEEGTEGNMVLGIIPTLGLGMPIFEDPNQKKDWRIYEWGQDEEDTSGAASAMFDWIRLDAEFEWLCICEFKQPDYMWAAQLTKDRDVVAQHEAIDALKHMPSLNTSTSFLRAVLDPKCFYKIRMEATYGLASCATPSLNWVGLHQLNKMFNKRYCFPVSSFAQAAMDDDELPMVTSIPKPNNFTSLPDYFIQKASVVAFSQIRDDRGLTPVRIRQFLLDLLKYNDNIGNEFSDCYYVATLVSSLGDALIPANDDAIDDIEGEQVNAAAKAEIERFRTLDYVIPTYHNIVTVTCLRTMTKLMLKNLLPVNISMFMQYTRYGNYLEIRLTAFDSLFILCGLSDPILNRYLINVIKEDPSVFVSHYVARAMLAWLGLAMKQNSETPTGPSRYVEEFAEEEGRVIIDDDRLPIKKTAQQEFQSSIENLRKRFENDTALQQSLWDLLNSSENAKLDHCIRKYLLQFCEYMFKPIDVGLKVTIRVPTLPPQNTEDNSEPPTPTSAPIIRFNKPKHRPEDKPPKQKKTSIHIKTENLSNDASLTSADTVSSPASFDMMDITNGTIDEEVQNRTIVETPSKPKHKPVPEVEKAVVVPPPTPSSSAPMATEVPKPKPKKVHSASAEEIKKCRRLLNKLTKLESALYFNDPVDEVLDQAPGYYAIVKKPMYLKKIKEKVVAKEYSTFSQFEDDIRLMLNNCYLFNPPGSHVYTKGQDLEAAFEHELQVINGKEVHDDMQNMTIVESPATTPRIANATIPASPQSNVTKAHTSNANPTSVVIKPPKPAKVKSINSTVASTSSAPVSVSPVKTPTHTIPSPQIPQDTVMTERKKSITPVDKQPKPVHKYAHLSEYEKMDQVLTKTMTSPHAFEFLRPVDPIKQGIPHYAQIIKHPMDLGKIKSQLRNRQYPNAQAMNSDMHLMFNNCYTFNPEGTYVYNESKMLQEVYEKEWRSYFGKRRLSTDVTKKPKEHHATPPTTATTHNDSASPVAKQNTIRIKPLDKPGSPSSTPKVSSKPPKAPKPAKEASPSISKPTTSNAPPTEPIAAVVVPLPITEKSRTKPPAYPMNEANKEKSQRIMKKLWSLKESEPFHKPVDVVALNIPTYYEIIKRPMDMSLIQRKLDNSEYKTVWDFERDIRQMFWNCYGFNHPESIVVTQSRVVEKFFHQIWSAEFSYPDAIKGDEKNIASKVVDKLTLHDAACWFNEPVDTVALPDYLTVVKHPMDLRTIWERLESGKYTSLKALDSDIRLVFKNCAAYNKPDTVAAVDGAKLEKYYNSISKEMRARMNGGNSTVSPSPSSSKKRRPSSSPAPVKMTHSVSLSTEEQPPAKIPKVSSSHGSNGFPPHQPKKDNHSKKDHPPKPARKPSIKEEEAAPYMNAMDIDPIMSYSSVSPSQVLINPPATVRSPTVVKSPAVGAVSHSPTSVQSPSAMSKPSNSMSPSAHTLSKSPSQEAPTKLHPTMYAKLESLLKKMMKHTCAFGFTEPVDPVALNIPHYPMIIKKPMDFGTMMTKLKNGQYKCVRDFESDMRLIFTNCYTFNGFEHAFSENAKVLEQILNKEAPILRKKESQLRDGISSNSSKPSSGSKSSSSKSSSSSNGKPSHNKPSSSSSKIPDETSPEKAELRKYKSVLDKLMAHESYYAFGAPVDPVLLQIPTYFDIIKKPMDFGTIRKKYERGKYANGDQLLRDVEQVFINCYLFNIPDDVVTRMGHSVQREFNRLCRARGLRTVNVDIPDTDEVSSNNIGYDNQFHPPPSSHL